MKTAMYWVASLALLVGAKGADSSCERLQASLTYTQEEAPRDLSSVLPVVVAKVNQVLDGVIDVEVNWTGADLHGRVGEHIVECTVTRLASAVSSANLEVFKDEEGRDVTSQCFHVPFTIKDTNECLLSSKHPMRHKCASPSICVNTIGSYECVCPSRFNDFPDASVTVDASFWESLVNQERSPWELSFNSNSKSSCPSSASTHGCCIEQAFTSEGSKCRQQFHCPSDPCQKSDCASNAQCVLAESPLSYPNYKCECPEGLMGNGHACQPKDPKPQPKLKFDGITPTEATIKNNYYCGCTKPIVDACDGFPTCGKHQMCTVDAGNKPSCECKPGYVKHEKYGCVDVHPPTLKLRHDPHGDQTLRLKQGDEYREYMVDIMDENAEDYLRSLKISYSRPLPPGCLTDVGEFYVNYTVAMPWATTPFVRITRRVVIDDIDECTLDVSKYQQKCPPLVPQCDRAAGAKCINTIGSYSCQCPARSSGDGFLASAKFDDSNPAPNSYQGGTSCVDTSKPVITLNGPNPKVFKICECGGLSGIMSQSTPSSDGDKSLAHEQRNFYETDIKEMVRASSGAELCASHDNPNPTPQDCAKAIDRTYQGDVDLSSRVVIGEPVRKTDLHWRVPYNVKDDAGNAATTVWRDVIVEEVELSSLESKIRKEVTKEQEAARDIAIKKAIRDERMKWDKEQAAREASTRTNRRSSKNSCPACPPCDCPKEDGTSSVSKESCTAYCENISRSCTYSDEGYIYAALFRLEELFPPSIAPIVLGTVVALCTIFFVRAVFSFLFSSRPYHSYDYGNYGDSGDDLLLRQPEKSQSMVASKPSEPQRQQSQAAAPASNSFFSPGSSAGMSNAGMSSPMPPSNSLFSNGSLTPVAPPSANRQERELFDDSIYATPSIITPSRNGDGVRRRNPYA